MSILGGLMSSGMASMGGHGVNISMELDIDWRGDQVLEEAENATRDILMDIAKDIIIIAKSTVHVITGTLMRSIKADRPSEVRDRTDNAMHRDLGHPIPYPERIKKEWVLMVGGTTFYAIYEELLHPYMEPALEAAAWRVDGIVENHKI